MTCFTIDYNGASIDIGIYFTDPTGSTLRCLASHHQPRSYWGHLVRTKNWPSSTSTSSPYSSTSTSAKVQQRQGRITILELFLCEDVIFSSAFEEYELKEGLCLCFFLYQTQHKYQKCFGVLVQYMDLARNPRPYIVSHLDGKNTHIVQVFKFKVNSEMNK